MRTAIRSFAILATVLGLAACAQQQEEVVVFDDEPIVVLPKS